MSTNPKGDLAAASDGSHGSAYALARELRWICKHDSFTVADCTTCAAADAIEDADRLRAAAGLAFFAVCEEAAAYHDPIDHVNKAVEALRPFFPRGVNCFGVAP